MKQKPMFPKDFLWGGSTAAHQVEGGNHNQWTVWELANAARMAKTAKRRLGYLANWEEIKPYAEDPNNYVSGIGIDHFRRYREDFDLLQLPSTSRTSTPASVTLRVTGRRMSAARSGFLWSTGI
jgi:beta-glucosidase/6-phospho-beta-glucosidase/beta-galactosidase